MNSALASAIGIILSWPLIGLVIWLWPPHINKYRILRASPYREEYCVQIRRWWLPFYYECHAPACLGNEHASLKGAESFVELHKKGFVVGHYT